MSLFCIGNVSVAQTESDDVWPAPERTHKPGVIWWIPGSAMDRQNMTDNLTQLSSAGFGGMSMVPIYGVRGAEDRFLQYLSPEWIEMYEFAVSEAERLDLWLDLTPGTGWKIGGPNLESDEGELSIRMRDGEIKVSSLRSKVKRSAPGGEGLSIDPYSVSALRSHLKYFDEKLANSTGAMPRAFYHDSFEYNGNWTNGLLQRFEQDHGYSLEAHLPVLFSDEESAESARVRSDYRETLSDLHYEFLMVLRDWVHRHGSKLREQAHGAPGNIFDMYALADIPETEVFGASEFPIPGFRRDVNLVPKTSDHHPLVNRVASSAAHVSGHRLVSSESFTWLREHFNVALSHLKPEAESLFLNGVNHLFYHGNCYSPVDEEFPGWLFYASTEMNPRNSIWHDVPVLNAYIQRCQSLLQDGKPDNDVLVYWPYFDVISKPSGRTPEIPFRVHNHPEWLSETDCGKLATKLTDQGFTYDFISDRYLQECRTAAGNVTIGGNRYQAILVPRTQYMPLETLRHLSKLNDAGAKIAFLDGLPESVPGLGNLEKRLEEFQHERDLLSASIPTSQVGGSDKGIRPALSAIEVYPEPMVDSGLKFIRRQTENGCVYFIVNHTPNVVDQWIPLKRSAASAIIMDPMTGRVGAADLRQTDSGVECFLQLAPGETCFVRLGDTPTDLPAWPIWERAGEPITLTGPWQVDFVAGGPEVPEFAKIDELKSWTELGGKAESFSGTARYTIKFELPQGATDAFELSLGDVRESARVFVNGLPAATLVANPFHCILTGLRAGENEVAVEVTNLTANRIRDLDRRGVVWRKFYDINFVNINYKPFDASQWSLRPSGLLGPVTLTPVIKRTVE
ncbi:MAG: hypothetical protein KDB00_20325 [Planctomycetales bacterium]|nr:hypothetical protein [Planctomycetales bacterium]